jgi:hypothetical protein
MAVLMADVIKRVRVELGDTGAPFLDSFLGTGTLTMYDLTEFNIWDVSATWIRDQIPVNLVADTDYSLNTQEGRIYLLPPVGALPQGDRLLVSGKSGGLFSDDELEMFVNDSVLQHTKGRETVERYRDTNGFIKYQETPVTLENLPAVEGVLIALRASIEALWALATDASTDVDISSADGTTVPRSQRYRQLRQQIDGLTDRYNDLCAQMNVGLNRLEVGKLRRVSRFTGRLVPVFASREYDDYDLPRREVTPVDIHNEDLSGVASPVYGGWW